MKPVLRHHVLGLLCLMLAFSVSCTRELEPSSSVRLDLSQQVNGKTGKQATVALTHIAVNIHGIHPDGSPLVYSWDACDQGDCTSATNTPPAQIVLDVPPGKSILVQYLGVEEDTTSETMTFRYGDKELTTQTGDNPVSIVANTIGSTTSGVMQVYGRVISDPLANNGAGVGPTGTIIGKIRPPDASKPAMSVVKNELFGGWGELFLISGVNFDLVHQETGKVLFSNASPSHAAFQPSNSIIKVDLPSINWVAESDGSTNLSYRLQDRREDFTIGFYTTGPDLTSTHSGCYDGASGVTIANGFTDSSGTNPLRWYGDGAGSTIHVNHGGGGVTISAACSDNNRTFKQTLHLDYNLLAQHPEEALPIEGPFLKTLNSWGYYETITASMSGANIALSWQFLPGATSGTNAITGVGVFQLNTSGLQRDDIMDYDDGYMCGALADLGYRLETTVPTSTTAAIISNTAYNPSNMSWNAAPKIILCPYRDAGGVRHWFSTAVQHHSVMGAGGLCEYIGGNTNYAARGSGTLADPYVICNAGQLQDFGTWGCDLAGTNSSDCGASLALHENIDFNSYGNTMAMIGSTNAPFSGNFQGNGYDIYNISISDGTNSYVGGLFSTVSLSSGNAIENFDVVNVNINATSTGQYVGGLIGVLLDGEVRNVKTASGSINSAGATAVGGLIGKAETNAYVHNVSSSVNVSSGYAAGGLIGYANLLQLNTAVANGSVHAANSSAGGLIGEVNIISPATWTWLEAHGPVTAGANRAGGLIGTKNYSATGSLTISESYATGAVSIPSGYEAGGIIGYGAQTFLNRVYATGAVHAISIVGGLAGMMEESQVRESYTHNVSVFADTGGIARAGGLVGQLTNSDILDSYSRATIGCTSACTGSGGLVGRLFAQGSPAPPVSISNCYAAPSTLPGTGGFIGLFDPNGNPSNAIFTANFWDATTSGVANAHEGTVGDVTGVTGKTIAQMKTETTFTDFSWLFPGIWKMDTDDTGYPELSFEQP